MRFSIDLSQTIVKAARVQDISDRARDRGIADHRCELGHGKGTRSSIWHFYCSQEVAALLVEELDGLSTTATTIHVREECARAVAILRRESERPLEAWEHGRRLVDTISGRPAARPTIQDAGLVHRRPDPAS